jgi:hypothetical protein
LVRRPLVKEPAHLIEAASGSLSAGREAGRRTDCLIDGLPEMA